ncbi:MAG: hypothetical protein D6803_01915 [Anaerolineae bacterium]|nr:MAG: hypothetical protein D6803_01915 [Anaerolineae bacterium]
MDELVQLIVEKTGLSEDVARNVVTVVLDFLKERLPEPVGSNLEALLEGVDLSDGLDLGDVMGGLGALFGGDK